MNVPMFLNTMRDQLNEIFGRSVKDINDKLVQIAKKHGGKAYLVGGAVRDSIMGTESKDLDYLITKTPIDVIAKELSIAIPSAKIDEVGKSFGIIKMNLDGEDYDIAIPRADEDRNNVKTDPNIGVEQDLLRRDTTMNALAQDLETGEIVSPPGYDGIQDIKNKTVRAVGNPVDRFREDPLRILRVISQSIRFGFDIQKDTLEAIKRNKDLLKKVSGERFSDEFLKGWTKGTQDRTRFFSILMDTGIGMMMFGTDFDPIPLKADNKDDTSTKYIKQYIASFLKGGNYEVMDKRAEMHRFVQVARILYDLCITNRPLLEKDIRNLSNAGSLFGIILETFNEISDVLGNALKERLSKPIIPKKESNNNNSWEIPITGGEIIDMAKELGIEIKGKAISETINRLIDAYQRNEIEVIPNDNKERIKEWLKRINLKESFIKDELNLDVLKERINNIFYK